MAFSTDDKGITFKPTETERKRYGDLPPGRYPFVILEAEPIEDERGAYFNLKLSLDDASSPYAGKWVWQKLYFKAGTVRPKAVEHGTRGLGELCAIMGVTSAAEKRDFDKLAAKMVGIPVECDITVSQGQDRTFTNVAAFYMPSENTKRMPQAVPLEDLPF